MAKYNMSIKNQQFEALKNVKVVNKANRDYELQLSNQRREFGEVLQMKN